MTWLLGHIWNSFEHQPHAAPSPSLLYKVLSIVLGMLLRVPMSSMDSVEPESLPWLAFCNLYGCAAAAVASSAAGCIMLSCSILHEGQSVLGKESL